MFLPGFFVQVELADNVLGPPGGDLIDVAGLNFGLCLCESEDPAPYRFTTWGMQADAATVYQSQGTGSQILIADAGNIYVLDKDVQTDDGNLIHVVVSTGPLPNPPDGEAVTHLHRLHDVVWQIATPPPVQGVGVILTVIDVDNAQNAKAFSFTQYDTKVRVRVGLNARQWTLRWDVLTGTQYDIISYGFSFQQLQRPYRGYSS